MEARSPAAALERWTRPGFPFAVRYPLALLYEIEFAIGEGYRRIPYGGVEHAGVLFGKKEGNEVTLEAFRQIECEHAGGPGFALSEADRERGRALMRGEGDEQLRGLAAVGLVVSHGRHELSVTGEEVAALDGLFPGGVPLLLAVKPEKFKPTRFAYTARVDGEVLDANLQDHSFVLPPPPRSERRRGRGPEEGLASLREPSQPVPADEAEPVQDPELVKEGKQRAKRARRRAAPRPEEPVEVTLEPLPALVPETMAEGAGPARESLLRRAAFPVMVSATGLVLLPCLAYFYANFLEAPIALHGESAGMGWAVTWDPSETASAAEAELKMDGNTIYLSDDQRSRGRLVLPKPVSDSRVELDVPHWFHTRRGILRIGGR